MHVQYLIGDEVSVEYYASSSHLTFFLGGGKFRLIFAGGGVDH